MALKILILGAALVAQAIPDAPPRPARRASGNLQVYFSTDDYPAAALRRLAEGVVHFSVDIDREGVPSRCTVNYSSGDLDLDRATCEIIMSRARLSPARDADGRPVADRVSNRVRWMLPEPLPGYAFLPGWMASSAAIISGRISCRWWTDEVDPQTREGEICAETVGPEALHVLRTLATDAELTFLWRIAPDGAAPPPPAPEIAGELLFETAARLSVAPDGRVADCRITRRTFHQAPAPLEQTPDLCMDPLLTAPKPFWPDSRATGPRLGSVTFQIYLRGGRRRPS